MTVAICDLWQTAYVLGMQASGIQGEEGRPEDLAQKLAGRLETFYTRPSTVAALGKWSTAWGPAGFEKGADDPLRRHYADNVMYVAVNADRSVYVVCIAGTNGKSIFDISKEDLDVENACAWQTAFPSLPNQSVPQPLTPYISQGTANGVNALLGMTDEWMTRQTLLTFLASVRNTGATLIFSGHSLGGALAPTLALALFNPSSPNRGPLSQSDWQAVYAYPTAGPTPGNGDLATFFSQAFPIVLNTSDRPYRMWNANIWNTLDVIPHAWEITMLGEIPTLYKVSPDLQVALRNMVASAMARSDKGAQAMGGTRYTMLPNQPLAGSYVDPVLGDMNAFEAEVLRQHILAYNLLLGVEGLIEHVDGNAFAPIVNALLSGRTAARPSAASS